MTKNQTTSPSENEDKIAGIKVLALWKSFSPDVRPYKPSTPIIEFDPPLVIAIDMPLEKELIKNAAVIAAAQLSNQTEPKPQFTPLGMRYIIDQFEAAMKNGEQEEKTKTSDDEDWDEGEEKTKKSSIKTQEKDDEEWEDEDDSKEEDKDSEWNEEWEEDK